MKSCVIWTRVSTKYQEDNGGSLRFYKTTSPGVDLTLKEGWEYSGFAKIVDLVYKEVRR